MGDTAARILLTKPLYDLDPKLQVSGKVMSQAKDMEGSLTDMTSNAQKF